MTLLVAALLSGCDAVVMSPSGDVAVQQRDLLVWATVLMLLVIVPVIVLTLWFAWHYRESNTEANYKPDWTHSTVLELVIWSVPLMIIIALGAMTWVSTHKLDPYRPLDRIDAQTPVPVGLEPLTVEVVALDWKWLFIYPEQGIATVNELAAPVNHDEFLLHSGHGRTDLCHGGHGNQAAWGDQRAGRLPGLFGQLQWRRLLADEV